MKKMTPAQLCQLYDRLDTERTPFLETWDEIAAYMRPSMFAFNTKHAEGEKRTYHLYDSTALNALDDLSHFLSNSLTPYHLEWLALEFQDAELNKRDAAREWLDKVVRIIHQTFNGSNFHAQSGEFYADLPCFGTAAIGAEPRYRYVAGQRVFDGVCFKNIHLRGLVGLEDQYGRVTLTIRKYEDSAQAWYDQFDEDSPKCVLDSIANNRPEEKFTVLHAVYPRDDDDIEPGPNPVAAKMPYASVWIAEKDKALIRESGYMELPRAFVRWSTLIDTAQGQGPGANALPDVRTLNEAKRLELEAFEKNLDPPMKTRANNIVGDLEVKSGGLTVVRDMDGLAPLLNGTDFSLTMVKTDEMRQAIKQAFYSDLINTPAEITKQMTAYEVARRLERAQRILGEAIGRVREEFLSWVVERVFGILMREGQLPAFPQELVAEFGRARLNVRYTSPIHITQRAQALEQTTMLLSDMSGIAQVMSPADPSAWPGWDLIDFDGLVLDMAERRSVPAAALRDEAEVKKIRQARAIQQAQERALAKAEAAARVVKDVGAGAGEGAAQNALRTMDQGAGRPT